MGGRRRQPNVEGGRPGRHNVKTTPEEEAVLLLSARAQGVTPARFLVEAGLAVALAEHDGVPETATARRRQVQQLFALQGQVGEVAFQVKKVGTNVNQLTKAVHQGSALPIEEMRAFLVEERAQSVAARKLYDRITELIEKRAAQGIGA